MEIFYSIQEANKLYDLKITEKKINWKIDKFLHFYDRFARRLRSGEIFIDQMLISV